MTLKEIAVFKKFIAHKDLRREFIRAFNRSKKWTGSHLPKSIEEYFSNVDPYCVITKAVRICKPNSCYGYDFWQGINEEWKENFQKLQSSHTYQNETGLSTLSGYFNVLRENWDDKDKPWVFEDVNVAAARLGLAPIEPTPKSEPAPCQLPADSVPPAEESPAASPVNCGSTAVPEADDSLDIDFIDFDTTTRRTVNALTKGILSVNTRSHSWRVTINRTDTKDARKKSLTHAMIGKTKSGDVMLMLCRNSKGIPIVFNADDYLNINSRQFVDNFNRLLSVTDDLAYLRIEKVSEKLDSITYKVTKQ